MEGSLFRSSGWEVPIGSIVGSHSGRVSVACVDARGVGAGMGGVMGGCACEARG